jgi:Ion channel.
MLRLLLTGMPIILCNMLLQSLVAVGSLRLYHRLFHHRDGLFAGAMALFATITIVLAGNLLQILLWALLFLGLGEFSTLHDAAYHSGVNFATLGYGDVIMSDRWKLLGPMEALNGALMVGLSGASMLAVMQHHVRKQLKHLPIE